MPGVIDSLSGVEFATYQDYLDHTSSVTGFKPTDPEHNGKRGLLVAKKALARTGSLTPEKEAAIDANLDSVQTNQVQEKLAARKAVRVQERVDARVATRIAKRQEARQEARVEARRAERQAERQAERDAQKGL